jgi:hypothetical protein
VKFTPLLIVSLAVAAVGIMLAIPLVGNRDRPAVQQVAIPTTAFPDVPVPPDTSLEQATLIRGPVGTREMLQGTFTTALAAPDVNSFYVQLSHGRWRFTKELPNPASSVRSVEISDDQGEFTDGIMNLLPGKPFGKTTRFSITLWRTEAIGTT